MRQTLSGRATILVNFYDRNVVTSSKAYDSISVVDYDVNVAVNTWTSKTSSEVCHTIW